MGIPSGSGSSGKLEKLTIVPESGGGTGGNPSLGGQGFTCQFNPEELTFSKSNKWTFKTEMGANVPKVLFGGGTSDSLEIKLVFDTTNNGKDVRTKYEKLLELASTKPSNDPAKKSQPPHVRVSWGNLMSFVAVIESVSQSFPLFSKKGTPLRAHVTVKLREAKNPDDKPGTNPTTRTEVRRTWVVERGQRLDWIAYQAYGDSGAWRHIAESNDILDPQTIRPGRILKLPRLE
jgi:hypothetical protein